MPSLAPSGLIRRICRAVVVALALASPLTAQLIVVNPISYTAPAAEGQAQGGSFNYFDDGGRQLTDGTKGVNDWTADLGKGNAWEWVAWITFTPTITFNFSGNPGISQVTIGLSRAESAGIYIPASITIGSETFALTSNAFPDQSRQDLTFNLAQPFLGNQLNVTFGGNVGRWTFVDEMQFLTTIPEPSTTALLALGVVGARLRRRRT
jgi:hypothetical protein